MSYSSENLVVFKKLESNLNSSSLQVVKYTKLVLLLYLLLNLNVLSNAQEITLQTDDNFWHINTGNYLNNLEANNELTRLTNLGFRGEIVEVTENATNFHQLRLGCYLNEATASVHLNLVNPQLRYPNLSKLSQSEGIPQNNDSICLGYEVGLDLPENWQLVQHDSIFLVSVKLLDYEYLMAFNGSQWQSLKSIQDISNEWFETNSSNHISDTICQTGKTQNIVCEFEGNSIATAITGEILWQNKNTSIYKHENKIGTIKLFHFE